MISSFAQLLKTESGDNLSRESVAYLDFILDASARLKDMIKGLLVYSRINTRVDPQTLFPAVDALNEAAYSFRHIMEEEKITLDLKKLPRICASYNQMVQVFYNLIDNSLKFRDKNRKLIIDVDYKKKDGFFSFSLKDNGIGIDNKYSDRVFDVFSQLSPKEVYPGTSLGLAICRKIIESHGETIWFESEPSNGTVFYFTIYHLPVS